MGCKPCREKRIQLYLARGMSREEAEKHADKIMPLIEKVMLNRNCSCNSPSVSQRWVEYYLAKNLSKKEAERLTKNLLKRLDRRLKREHLCYEPMFLIEQAGEGVLLYQSKPPRLRMLRRWIFHTNWRATLFWSIFRRQLLWIGKGGNSPFDYTQVCLSCVLAGTCGINICTVIADCRKNFTCTPGCPLPTDPNSSLTLNPCTCIKSGCLCTGTPTKKCGGTSSCIDGGENCEYTCNPGFVWNGLICVPAVVAEERFDGYYFLDPA